MIKEFVLPSPLPNFAAETPLPNGSNAAPIQSRQVALLHLAITSLHPPNPSNYSAVLDTELGIELEDHTMGCADTERGQPEYE